mmetsp:Transcript_15514/g.41698  ORF Transcript_15514/g.41698 Transcript_15514/m.41698 type:complete len:202 (-) Transcript_15514:220-825(-)
MIRMHSRERTQRQRHLRSTTTRATRESLVSQGCRCFVRRVQCKLSSQAQSDPAVNCNMSSIVPREEAQSRYPERAIPLRQNLPCRLRAPTLDSPPTWQLLRTLADCYAPCAAKTRPTAPRLRSLCLERSSARFSTLRRPHLLHRAEAEAAVQRTWDPSARLRREHAAARHSECPSLRSTRGRPDRARPRPTLRARAQHRIS